MGTSAPQTPKRASRQSSHSPPGRLPQHTNDRPGRPHVPADGASRRAAAAVTLLPVAPYHDVRLRLISRNLVDDVNNCRLGKMIAIDGYCDNCDCPRARGRARQRQTCLAARLLTAAVRVRVQLQSCDVRVPAQGVNEPRVWGPAQQREGFPVGPGEAEASQVAARGQVVVQRRRQRRLLLYLQQEAKLKGCRKEGRRSHSITAWATTA